MASDRPPRVIRLIVCPVSHIATSAPHSAIGMLRTTTMTLRQSRRKSNTISPVRTAPRAPSVGQAANGVGDRGRLVELETDLDVVGQDRLHARAGPS